MISQNKSLLLSIAFPLSQLNIIYDYCVSVFDNFAWSYRLHIKYRYEQNLNSKCLRYFI